MKKVETGYNSVVSSIDKNSPSRWPFFGQDEIDVVSRVMRSGKVNYWTGTESRRFENEFAKNTGVKHAVALANGTVALELALKALGIGPGDEVVVTPRSFIASVSCVISVGAKPVFADVNPDSGNITADSISCVLTDRTKAIIPVHLAGWSCEMDEIISLARAHELYVIEDCAQAHGSRYKEKLVGGIGHIGAWSFCQDKIITTGGEGGMITTDDEQIWSYAWSYKDHGKNYETVRNNENSNGFRWVHHSIGTNWRMTEMQAAIGKIQLRKLPQWHERRKKNAQMILSAAKACPALRVPDVPSHIEHAWYKCYVYVRPEALSKQWSRDRIMSEINKRGVLCYSGICPEIYLEKAFDNNGLRPAKRLPVAKILGETSLMFLVHPTLTDTEIYKTCTVLIEVMGMASDR